ncbi:hypothetical protein [Streptomyces rubellomurinus]|uniref:Uncharacterized protein n=1 Tax=Streptomyces sp. Y1 TaxID=3238634 RepID=A0AB39TVD5_9ACTN|nr:hypothetical protein [Streptomyces rubellomurinus]
MTSRNAVLRPGKTTASDLPTEGNVLASLREVATEAGKDFILIFTPEDEPFDPLITG